MKTKHRILSVLTILALVASLTAVMVAPAGAITRPTAPTILPILPPAGNIIDAIGVSYTDMSFTIHRSLYAGDVVVLTFPGGTGFDGVTVTAVLDPAPAAAPIVTAGDNVIRLTVAAASPISAGTEFTVSTGTGVVNPTTPGSHTYTVMTSRELTPVASVAYTIRGIKVTGGPTATPRTAAAGTTMTVVGAGYAAGSSLDILLDDYEAPAVVDRVVVGSTTVAADGTFTGTFTMTEAGDITARDGAGRVFNTAVVTLAPSITVTPTSGLVGTGVTIRGSGFTGANIPLGDLTFAGAAWNTAAAIPVAAGRFTISLNVPAGETAGVKSVKAVDVGGASGSATFDVTARAISLSPTSGVRGSTVTIIGSGFKASVAGAPVTASVAMGGISLVSGISVGSDGSFTASFVVPGGAADGANTVTATDTAGNSASTSFTATAPSVSVSPSSGTPGSTVTVSGTGFTGHTPLSLLQIGGAIVTPIPSVLTDSMGDFTATFIVPSIGAGAQTVTATAGPSKTTTFTITAVAVAVADGLSSIEGKFTRVWAFDAAAQEWLLFDPAAPEVSDLAILARGKGYWIEVTEDATIVHGGNTYNLVKGWNLIGWLG